MHRSYFFNMTIFYLTPWKIYDIVSMSQRRYFLKEICHFFNMTISEVRK